MAGKIYILFECDQWKSLDSMRMVCASTDARRMATVIDEELAVLNMSFFYGNSDETESQSAFQEFLETDPELKYANSYLENGHLEIVDDGEVL